MPARIQITELKLFREFRRDRRDDERQQDLVHPQAVRDRLDGVHECDRPHDDQGQGGDDLKVHDPESWYPLVAAVGAHIHAMKPEGSEVGNIHVRIPLEVRFHVPRIDAEEQKGHHPLEPDRLQRQERGSDGDAVGDGEVAHVMREQTGVDLHRVTRRSPPGHDEDGHPGHEHGQGGQHERCPEDGPDADLLRGLAGREHDGDDRDHRRRKGCPDRRQDGADHAFREFQFSTEPLDAVGEQLKRRRG